MARVPGEGAGVSEGLISYKDVEKLTSLNRRTILRKIESDDFPTPINLGPQRKAFVKAEVLAWIDELISKQR